MNEQIAGQENFSLPHDVVLLPSQGKYYKSKKKSVKVGYLTANDENLLANIGKIPAETLMLRLIREKLYEPDLNPSELLEGDVEAILLFLRNTSFGHDYTFKLVDPETGNIFEKTIYLDEINFKKPEVEPDENGYYTTQLPKSGVEVKLRPLSYGDVLEIERMAEDYPAGLVAPKVTWRLQKQLVEVNNNPSKEEISKFINTMPIMDSKYITTFLSKNSPKLNLDREITAPSGKKVNAKITFGVEFFRPFF